MVRKVLIVKNALRLRKTVRVRGTLIAGETLREEGLRVREALSFLMINYGMVGVSIICSSVYGFCKNIILLITWLVLQSTLES